MLWFWWLLAHVIRAHEADYRELASGGQHPSLLFIGCSDARVMPHLLLDSMPGEVFMVRNTGNFVPCTCH